MIEELEKNLEKIRRNLKIIEIEFIVIGGLICFLLGLIVGGIIR